MQILAEIITIGDEILYGQITDTNSQWLCEQLSLAGIKVHRKTSITDRKKDILQALEEATTRSHITITTGGLGPTKDDITKHTIAEFFGTPFTLRPEVLENIRELFRQRGRELTQLNEMQAHVPANGDAIVNKVGTAPGMWFPTAQGHVLVSMPGVPHEMKKMMSETVIPRLIEQFHPPVIYHRMIKTIGIAESKLAHLIEPWEVSLPEHIRLAYLPRLGQVRLRLTAFGTDRQQLALDVQAEIERLQPLAAQYIYAYDDEEIEYTVGQLLKERNQTVALAESCTGGMTASRLTDIPGSSAYFNGGVVAYSNRAKAELLGVKEETLAQWGAVSEQTAIEMAIGARDRFHTHYGLSATGIAGPDGGTPEKPVGTIWIGFADKNGAFAKKLSLTQDRQVNRQFTHNALMHLLRSRLLGVDFDSTYTSKR